jgi:hypothetical protein
MRALVNYVDANDGLTEARVVNVLTVGRNNIGPKGSAFTIRISDGLLIFNHNESLIHNDTYKKVLQELLNKGYVDLTAYGEFVDKHTARREYEADGISVFIPNREDFKNEQNDRE